MSSEINCQKEMEKVTLCCLLGSNDSMRLFFVVSVSGIKLVSLWYSKSSESYC